MRVSSDSSSASRSTSAWLRKSTPRSSSSQVSDRRAVRSTMPGVSSSVAAVVIRLTSSCASSMMSAVCSGSAVPPCMALMASSAWLVTTRSASRAWSRDFSTKHSSPNGQFATPRHSRVGIDTCAQPRAVWLGASSRSASPLVSACSSTHSRSANTSAPSLLVSSLEVAAASARAPLPMSESCSASPPERAR